MKATHKIFLLLSIAAFGELGTQDIHAQRLIKKELRSSYEDGSLKSLYEETDGFEFKWYLYKYLLGRDTIYAAFDLNGKRITPVNKHYGYKPFYCGGGMFMCETKEVNSFGKRIVVGYNLNGEQIFPSSFKCIYIFYGGDGFFKLQFYNDYGREIDAIYNVRGEAIIPKEMEYDYAGYHPNYQCFWTDYEDAKGNTISKYTYTLDGRYYAEGRYDLTNSSKGLQEFNAKKRPAPRSKNELKGGSAATPVVASTTSSSSSSSSSTKSSASSKSTSSKDGKLLYKGTYSSNGLVYTGNESMYVMAGTYEIEIYEKVLYVNSMPVELKEVMRDGTRKYDSGSGMWRNIYLVSSSFGVRRIYPSQFFGVPDGVEYYTKGEVSAPAQPQYNGGYNNTYQPTSSTTSPSTQPSQQQPSRIQCSYCNGTGEVKQDYNGWSSSVDDRKYCSKCGTTGPQHSHVPCPQCYGKGYK